MRDFKNDKMNNIGCYIDNLIEIEKMKNDFMLSRRNQHLFFLITTHKLICGQ